MRSLLPVCWLAAAALVGAETTIVIDKPMAPLEWALAERALLKANAGAAREFAAKYLDDRGFLRCVERWGGNDGPDDAMENFQNWTLAYALGAPQTILDLYKKAWEGHLIQYTQAKAPKIDMARHGMYYKEFITAFDWEHNGEGLAAFYFYGLGRPADRSYISRARRFAGFYLNEDPEAQNYDPEHKIIRSLHNGSRGSKITPASEMDWGGEPVPGDPERLSRYSTAANIRGDHPLNLCAATLAMNAYLLTREQKYRDWLLEYAGAWRDRVLASGGNIPTNIGLDGRIGGEWNGKWYGGVFGWNFWPESSGRNYYIRGPRIAFGEAFMLTADESFIEPLRRQIDNLYAAAKTEKGRTLLPNKHGDNGWYGYTPDQHFDVQRDIYLWSMKPSDRERIANDPWIRYLEGNNPGYPYQALQQEFARLRQRVDGLRKDTSTPDTRASDYSQRYNPVVTSALVNLTLGGNDPGTSGNILHSRVRYFDPVERRAGLPDYVAALVEKIRPEEIVLTLVNVDPVEPRRVTVQMGAYGEHHCTSVVAGERTVDVDAPHFEVRLAPGAGETLTVRMKRYAHAPTLAFPWDRAGSPLAASGAPTAEEARTFLDQAEAKLLALSNENSRAGWVQATYITDDTDILAAQANERFIAATVELAKQSARFDKLSLPPDLARKMKLLKLSLSLAAPADPKQSEELTRIVAGMESAYGKGKYCPEGKQKCLDLEEMSRILATSRDGAQLRDIWRGWRTIAPPMRNDFRRYVELANKGARELGFADTGAMWRSKYDMPPEAFARELDRLWEQVRPLYVSLHAYVRSKLRAKYGDVVPERGPIPAHLLGNMWAQSWDNIYPLVAPRDADPGFDLTAILKARKVDELEMVRYGERFFTSLGFAPLPKTFWERSLFTRPRDREVVCHASAWDVDNVDDLRIKMCIDITAEEFAVIHHELGHNFYQRAYNRQPFLFRDSANDGFHEAVGDTIALSITPQYLVKLGLLNKPPDASKDIGLLLQRALDKVAFLPFGLLIDQWRWKVLSGEIPPEKYNETWWELRRKYQGVAPPVPRSESDFDPGAKYHVPANVPYTRYFLAHILQFQFHRALAQAAACAGPLHGCSIYDNKEAGKRLIAMLEMGQSRPWPNALYALTGQREMDATAIRDYFAPLEKWLDEQNKGQPVGW